MRAIRFKALKVPKKKVQRISDCGDADKLIPINAIVANSMAPMMIFGCVLIPSNRLTNRPVTKEPIPKAML
ncbi:Uncharacterised protein [Vibrio cholerae]|nr:Uncharacterised protein [Vibrio cholerae]